MTFERLSCAITGAEDLEELYTFKDFPIYMGCTDQPEHLDVYEDMIWSISQSSGLIQLKKLLPLNILYREPHGSGSIGGLWHQHHSKFAEFINKANPKSVLEIGGGHGLLEKEYQHYGDTVWTIIEPNPSPVDGCKASFIRGFFGRNLCLSYTPDVVVHSHVMEHVYMPKVFMEDLSTFMKVGSYLIFSIPNMGAMMERKYANCINFEHTILLTEPYVEYLLSVYGYEIESKEYFKSDHSIFIKAVKSSTYNKMEIPIDLHNYNKYIFNQYVHYHEELVHIINSRLEGSQKDVYLFGAHVFSQYLINMGLNTSKIVSILDNDPLKQGRRLYGTNLGVMAPNILKDSNNPLVILRAGVYNREIKEGILSTINPSTVFLE